MTCRLVNNYGRVEGSIARNVQARANVEVLDTVRKSRHGVIPKGTALARLTTPRF
jgi:hypothetical protein